METTETWLVANWKMNGSRAAVTDYCEAVAHALTGASTSLKFIYCPPFPYLDRVLSLPVMALGGQNCSTHEQGAHTGEISAAMLRDVGCGYVILGHSERRLMGETDVQIAQKIRMALAAGLTPIICVGETADEYAAKRTEDVLRAQLAVVTPFLGQSFLIAYEPVWAIGTGKTPTPSEIAAAHAVIKSVLGSTVPVLYGGSVNAKNASEILAISGVSGALVGSASVAISSMCDIINAVNG